MGRIGILGGTFNPPHLGHLALARHAHEALGLDRVFLMPSREPPHKREAPDPGPRHRLAMCRLLVDGDPALSACNLETRRAGPSYTVETLRELHSTHPEQALTFIAGSDAVATLASWREPGALLELADVAIAARPGADANEALQAVAAVRSSPRDASGPLSRDVRVLEIEPLDVSSSVARERAARGEPIEALVGQAVADYIAEHGLYGAGAGASGDAGEGRGASAGDGGGTRAAEGGGAGG